MLIPSEAPAPYDQMLLLAERDPVAALELAQQSCQQRSSASLLQRAWSQYTLGWALLRVYELADAIAHLQQAQSTMAVLDQSTMVLHCRRAVLIAEAIAGASSDEQDGWAALTADYRAAGLELDAVRTYMHQIGYLNVIGLPQAALALGATIEPQIHAQGTADDRARLLRMMAVSAKQAGLLDQAREQLDQAAVLFASLDSPVEVAKCLLEQAHVAEREGAFAQARTQFHAALECFDKLRLPLLMAVCEKNLGIIASSLGQLDQALSMTLRARATFLVCGQHEQAASCDLSLGNVAYYSGLFDLAFGAYRRAQTAYTDLGLQRLMLIARRNQALVLQQQGHFSAAYAELCVLEAEVEALGDALELAEIYQAQAQALHSLQRYDAALERLARAEQQASLERQINVGECWLERGQIYFHLGDVRAAEACLYAAQATLDDRPSYIWRVLHALGRCAETRGATKIALDQYHSASNIVAQLRATLVNEHASSALFDQARQLYEDAIRLAAETYDIVLLLALAEEQRSLVLQQRLALGQLHIPAALSERYECQRQTLRALMHASPTSEQLDMALAEYTDLLIQLIHSKVLPERTPPTPVDVEHLRSACSAAFPDGWIVLSFVECGGELLLVVLDQTDLTLTRIPINLGLTRLLEQACLARLRLSTFSDWPRQRDPTRRPWAALSQLGEAFIPLPIRARLHPDLRLLIVPSERLHNLPWATLRIDDAWLCERAIIQTLPSIAWWQLGVPQPVPDDEALLIGCSAFGARAADLPTITTELDTVAEIWPGDVTRMNDAQVTRVALLRLAEEGQLARYSLLHIASHAQLSAAQGLLAHIMLWDEDMLYDEIVRLGLAGSLVVLSTCDGSVSEVLPGDEVMSLSRAFLMAGARDVIANLWPSYDELAPQLMRILYSYLVAGFDAAQAVTHMQRELLTQREDVAGRAISARSPLVWGGFQVVGGGTALAASASGTPR